MVQRLTCFLRDMVALLVLSSVLCVSVVRAEAISHDKALQAVRSGEILPLQLILSRVLGRGTSAGHIVDIRLIDREAGLHGWVYDITFYTGEGRVVRWRVDAKTASVLDKEE